MQCVQFGVDVQPSQLLKGGQMYRSIKRLYNEIIILFFLVDQFQQAPGVLNSCINSYVNWSMWFMGRSYNTHSYYNDDLHELNTPPKRQPSIINWRTDGPSSEKLSLQFFMRFSADITFNIALGFYVFPLIFPYLF